MTKELITGGLVKHPSYGIGKILSIDGNRAHVYFKNQDEQSPEKRVKTFRIPNDFITATNDARDDELDNLPPWIDGHFDRVRTSLSWSTAKSVFLRHFPQGLSDAKFSVQEER